MTDEIPQKPGIERPIRMVFDAAPAAASGSEELGKPRSDLEKDFSREMYALYSIPDEKYGKRFTRYKQMLDRYGGLETARRMLRTGSSKEGLQTLFDLGGFFALELSVEALVLREPWRKLFSETELSIARQRLVDFGYEPKSKT